jgi:hypothetical protein
MAETMQPCQLTFVSRRSREGFLVFLKHGGACLQAARRISRELSGRMEFRPLYGAVALGFGRLAEFWLESSAEGSSSME